MKFSPQVRYAVRILFVLSSTKANLSIESLASKTGMSVRAVENAHAVLKRHDITGAISGPGGGIFLKTPLSQVSVGNLLDWFESGVAFSFCCGVLQDGCQARATCGTVKVLHNAERRVDTLLHTTYLSDILHT